VGNWLAFMQQILDFHSTKTDTTALTIAIDNLSHTNHSGALHE